MSVMKIARGCEYDMDSKRTRRNNNVLIVGAPGTGKTTAVVAPNILEASGSYIVTDPKGLLYGQYKDFLTERGYNVLKINFKDPADPEGTHYNPISFLHDSRDVSRFAHCVIYGGHSDGYHHTDPFWDESSQMLLEAIVLYLQEGQPQYRHTLENVISILQMVVDHEHPDEKSIGDSMFNELDDQHPHSSAVRKYRGFQVGADKTKQSVVISLMSILSHFDSDAVANMTRDNAVDFDRIGQEKTALFLIISDTDRSLDSLASLFVTQCVQELTRYADAQPDGRLPMPIRFILDDFATNLTIPDFPRMISSLRSREISFMLILQAESQLRARYGDEWRTIIGACDTYVFLGCSDIDTCDTVSIRTDKPIQAILDLPVGHCWVLRRGEPPVYTATLDPVFQY